MPERPAVAVLGASGFIGSQLVEWLVLRDLATVRPIVRSFKGMARLARFDLDCRVADATDQSALENQLKDCEVLFHCVVGDRNTILQSAEAAYGAAAKAGVRRLVYLSSAVVYGHDPKVGTHDDSELISRQPYEYNVSKVRAERLLRQLCANGKVEVVTLRPSIVFGPRSNLWTAQIASDLLSGNAYLIDGGRGICNSVYVDNLIQAMWLAIFSESARNQTFFITDGERVTWFDLYKSVAEGVGVDIDSVPCIEGAELNKLYRKQRNFQLRSTLTAVVLAIRNNMPPEFIDNLRKILPRKVLEAIVGKLMAPQPPRHPYGGLVSGRQQFPLIDREIASLQRCNYVLPIDKARKLLGYGPPITFAEGCRRTREWLWFAFGLTYNK